MKSELLWISTVSGICPGMLTLAPTPLTFKLFNFAIYGNGDRLTRSPAIDRVDLALLPLRVKTAIELKSTQLPSRTSRGGVWSYVSAEQARQSLQSTRSIAASGNRVFVLESGTRGPRTGRATGPVSLGSRALVPAFRGGPAKSSHLRPRMMFIRGLESSRPCVVSLIPTRRGQS